MLKPKKPTIPVRLELEYMLDQRCMATCTAQGRSINEQKLRLRLRHIAMTIAHQKTVEVAALIGRPVRFPSMDTINAWVEQEVKATLGSPRQDAAREASQMQLMQELAKINAGQRERRASAAILSLNVGIIEKVAVSGGSSHYRWLTEQDSRVREWHADLEGTIQSWDDPPMGGGSHKEDSGHPGSGYGCRCLPVPIQGPERRAAPAVPAPEPEPKIAPDIIKRPRTLVAEGYKGPLNHSMSLKEAEDAIRALPIEHSMTWDIHGQPILIQSGTERTISMTAKEWQAIKATSYSWTHNHPTGNPSLSAKDIFFSMHADNMTIARAVTESRGGMEMIVTDRVKWKEAFSSPITKHRLIAAENEAAAVARQAVVNWKTGSNATSDLTDQWDVYFEAFARESEYQFNKVGTKYGFKVTRF